MTEWRLFDEDNPPEWVSADWYARQGHSPHLEQEGHTERLRLTARTVAGAVTAGGRDVCDLGAGDGGLIQAVRELGVTVPMWGYDLQPPNVTYATSVRGVDVTLADFTRDPVRYADVLVAAEVIEHLHDPHRFVRSLTTTGARWLVASSPYTETSDAHYEHHCWAWDLDGYRTLLETAGWRVIRQDTAWICQVLLAQAPQ